MTRLRARWKGEERTGCAPSSRLANRTSQQPIDGADESVDGPTEGRRARIAVEQVRDAREDIPEQVAGTALGADVHRDRTVVAVVEVDVQPEQVQINRPERQVEKVGPLRRRIRSGGRLQRAQ